MLLNKYVFPKSLGRLSKKIELVFHVSIKQFMFMFYAFHVMIHCVKIVKIRCFFWSVFSGIRTRKNSVFEHLSSSDCYAYFLSCCLNPLYMHTAKLSTYDLWWKFLNSHFQDTFGLQILKMTACNNLTWFSDIFEMISIELEATGSFRVNKRGHEI